MKKHPSGSQEQPESSSVLERETPAILPPRSPGKGLLRAFTSLRQRNFRLFWFYSGAHRGSWSWRHHHCREWHNHALSAQCAQLSPGDCGSGADQAESSARPGAGTRKRGRAAEHLVQGATGFGFLSAAIGVGALLSALWLAWSNQQSAIRRVLIGMLVFGVLEAVFALSRIYLLSLVLIASVGFMETAFAAQALATLQTITPDHLRGRVTSVQVLFFDGSLPLGYLLMGWLSGLCGPSLALLIGALLSLLVAGAGWMWRKQAERDMASI